ncbi:MAG: hypothetical protein ACOC0Z_02510 [Halohasta sp.]
MVSLIGLGLFGGVLVGHTLLAAVLTRFFRLRLETQYGWVIYTVCLLPVVLFASTLVFTGLLQIGPNLGSPLVVFGVMIGLPIAVGVTIDLLYVAQPDEVELPDTR